MSILWSGQFTSGGGLPKPTVVTKKEVTGRVSGTSTAIASLASGQALQTIIEITTPIAIGTLHVDAGGNASTIDRLIVTSDKGVIYDGDSTVLLNKSAWFLGMQNLTSNGASTGYQVSDQSFRMESLKIELETTSASSTTYVYSNLELTE